MNTANVCLVLVRPKYARNVGGCARALANMGGSRLILVDPQCDLDHEAREGAAGAQSYLEEATSYATWTEFYQECGDGLRVGLTKRPGKNRVLKPLSQVIKPTQGKTVYLILGPEDHGLSSEDLAFCNHCCDLPVFGKFASLNLAQAALLALYVTQASLGAATHSHSSQPLKEEQTKPLYFPDQSIREWLTTMGFDIKARRSSAYTTIRRLLLQNEPTEKELMVLEAILQQNIRKLKESVKD